MRAERQRVVVVEESLEVEALSHSVIVCKHKFRLPEGSAPVILLAISSDVLEQFVLLYALEVPREGRRPNEMFPAGCKLRAVVRRLCARIPSDQAHDWTSPGRGLHQPIEGGSDRVAEQSLQLQNGVDGRLSRARFFTEAIAQEEQSGSCEIGLALDPPTTLRRQGVPVVTEGSIAVPWDKGMPDLMRLAPAMLLVGQSWIKEDATPLRQV